MKTTQQYTIDGITYNSLDEMPPEVRERWNSMAEAMAAMDRFASKNAQPGRRTTFRYERTTVQTGASTQDFSPNNIDMGWADSLGVRVPSQNERITPKDKRISMAFCIVFFPTFGLALLPMISSVRTTVQYGPGWVIAYTVLMLALIAWGWAVRQKLRMKFFPKNDATWWKVLKTTLAVLAGFGVLAGYGVLGGAPILAHYLTSHPGELTVTVTRKESDSQRSACTPRLKIKEFTFFLRDHICPGARAFSEIGVGSRIRLEGQVSPFGITIERYYWTRNP